ncbi:beta strand repeat-containing protein, partial [Flavobacterium cerinum]|uniref:beta strand repeat-containing protein n=1 Tax=Flavobacterium cerinum TaxID=2502784 RepID=UPI0019D4BDF2
IEGDGDISSTDLEVTDGDKSTFKDVSLNIKDNVITNAKMADNAIGTAELIDNAVTTAKIADSNVTAAKLSDNAVTAAKIDASVAGTGLTKNPTTGALEVDVTGIEGDGDISSTDLEVTDGDKSTFKDVSLNIKDNVITNAKMADNSINTAELVNNAVTTAKINALAVTKDKINSDVAGVGLTKNATTGALDVNVGAIVGDGSITSTELTVVGGANATLENVTLTIADNTITNAKMADNAINTAELVNNAVTTAKIADNNVITSKINALAVTKDKINSDVAGVGLTKNATTGALDVNVGAIVGDGSITSTELTVVGGANATLENVTLTIADNAITNAKMADNAVNTSELVNNAVTTAKIADNNVITSKINALAVTKDKINSDVAGVGLTKNATTGALDVNVGAIVGDGSITSTELTVVGGANATLENVTLTIADNAITNAKMADNAVNTAELVNNAVTTAKIADNNVITSKINALAVTKEKINSDVAGVGLTKNATTGALDVNVGAIVGDGSITSTELTVVGGANATLENVTLTIADNAITNAKMADNAINTTELVNNAVTTAKIADNNITTNKIADSNVTAVKLSDNAVTAAKIDASVAGVGLTKNATTGALDVNVGAIVGDGSITSTELTVVGGANATLENVTLTIADNAITNAKMADNAVNTAELVNNAVTTAKIADNNVITSKINALAVTKDKINSDVAGTGLTKNATTGALDVNVGAIVGDGSITSTELTVVGGANATLENVTLTIADNAITNAKMADNAVNTTELVNNAVTTAKIADSNVTAAKLSDNAVTAAKIDASVAGTGLTKNPTTGALEVDVTGIEGDGDISSTDLEVTDGDKSTFKDVSLNIKDNVITNAKMADNA